MTSLSQVGAGSPSGLALAFIFPSVYLLLAVWECLGENPGKFPAGFLLLCHTMTSDVRSFFSTWYTILKRYKQNIVILKIDMLRLSFCAECCRKGAHGDWFNMKSAQILTGCLLKNKASHMGLSSFFPPILFMVAFFWCICVSSECRKICTTWQDLYWTQCCKAIKKSHLDFKMPNWL